MRVICIDDERLLMEEIVGMCRELPGIAEVTGFVSATNALEWMEDHTVDIALLDIDMPGMNGLQLAEKIKTLLPDTRIIFITGYADYAVDAFRIKASGVPSETGHKRRPCQGNRVCHARKTDREERENCGTNLRLF